MTVTTLCNPIAPKKQFACACRWQAAPADALLQHIAASTEGFAGADLQALCTAAVMAAVSRRCPHLVDQLCHTATTGLHPDPVSPSGRDPNHQRQQQPDIQQQQQPENQQQEQQQPNKQQEQLQAKLQEEQQEPLQQQQQQEESAWDQQQSDRQQQQQGQQQHQQPQDAGDGADRAPLGHQVTLATCQKQHQQQDRGNVLQCTDQNTQANEQKKHHVADDLSEKLPKKLMTKLRVKAADWRTALAAAPLPCSARQNMSALSSGHAKALPHHLAPLLLPYISRGLQCIAAAQLPWQGTTAYALEACAAAVGTSGGAAAAAADKAEAEAASKGGVERLLAELGAVERLTSVQPSKP